MCNYFLVFSHFWLATPQEVLQADWQEVWHSPQPPFFTLFARSRVSRVRILFMMISPLIKKIETNEFIIPHRTVVVKVSRKNILIAGVENRGYGRFLKKAPQKLLDWVAGLLG
jgi:hypothetical protein